MLCGEGGIQGLNVDDGHNNGDKEDQEAEIRNPGCRGNVRGQTEPQWNRMAAYSAGPFCSLFIRPLKIVSIRGWDRGDCRLVVYLSDICSYIPFSQLILFLNESEIRIHEEENS